MQTRLESFVESVINILIGYGIAISAQYAIFPLFDINVPLTDHLLIGALFTIVSITRSYLIRRLFNHLKYKK